MTMLLSLTGPPMPPWDILKQPGENGVQRRFVGGEHQDGGGPAGQHQKVRDPSPKRSPQQSTANNLDD